MTENYIQEISGSSTKILNTLNPLLEGFWESYKCSDDVWVAILKPAPPYLYPSKSPGTDQVSQLQESHSSCQLIGSSAPSALKT